MIFNRWYEIPNHRFKKRDSLRLRKKKHKKGHHFVWYMINDYCFEAVETSELLDPIDFGCICPGTITINISSNDSAKKVSKKLIEGFMVMR